MYIFIFLATFLFSEELTVLPTQVKAKEVKKEALAKPVEEKKVVKFKTLKDIKIKKEEYFLNVDKVDKEEDKIFYVEVNEINKDNTLVLGKVFLVYTYDENNFYIVVAKAIFVKEEEIEGKNFYKFATFVKLRAITLNNRISYIGKPTNKADLAKLNHAMMDYSNISRELGDMYFGSMSLYVSYGWSKLSTSASGASTPENPYSTSDGGKIYSSDLNRAKNYNFYQTYNLGYRWWFFFLSSLGLDINYFFTSQIPTYTKAEDSEERVTLSSSFTGYNISLMYRRTFFRMPAIFGAKYFIDNFKTGNTDEQLMSTKYSGLNLNFSWNLPYQFTILPLGFGKMVFHNFEFGAGLSPIVFASDTGFSRGARSNITSYRLNSSILFNFESKYLDFLKDIFFGLMYEYVSYSLNFTGETEGDIPGGTIASEKYQYIGLKVKYEFNDPFGDD